MDTNNNKVHQNIVYSFNCLAGITCKEYCVYQLGVLFKYTLQLTTSAQTVDLLCKRNTICS